MILCPRIGPRVTTGSAFERACLLFGHSGVSTVFPYNPPMPARKQSTADLRPYHCKAQPLQGHRFAEFLPQARAIFRALERQTKRRPYVRSAYFQKDKIFFDFFWTHLQQKIPAERARRLRYLPCALELLRHTMHAPLTIQEDAHAETLFHRFAGQTSERQRFYVQVKHDIRSGKKQLLSVFPAQRE